MRVAPVSSNSFTAIYKLKQPYSYYTEKFIEENKPDRNVGVAFLFDEPKYAYVITKNDEQIEKAFEKAVEKDHGSYWKLPPLMDLWINGSIGKVACRIAKSLNNGHEDWTDFRTGESDEISF